MYRKREEDTTMATEWMMNPELHDEDYNELMELMEEED